MMESAGGEGSTSGGGGAAADARQLAVLKEFANIANAVSDEEFLSTMPRSKLKRVKWLPLHQCLREQILEGVLRDWNDMWEEEAMSKKLEILEKQKEKFADRDDVMWRPQLSDVKAQLKAYDVACLQKQKEFLELQAKELESKVNKMKKTLTAKRQFLRVLQLDIQKCYKKNDDFCSKLNQYFDDRKKKLDMICPIDLEISKSPLFSRDEFDSEFN